MIARGDSAGSDARAYWAAVRIWLNGGDPYHPTGPFLPYVYAPWMLPLFTPWALLPWDVAWVVWRGSAIILLLWCLDWAYRRRPLATAVLFALLGLPIAANLDTGNITLYLAFFLWGAQFAGPRLAGLLWGLATWMKWVPAPFWLILAPRARSWGLIWLGRGRGLSLATLPLTIVQLQALFGFGARPIRLDYLVLLWALVPWWWRHPDRLWFLRPSRWPGVARNTRTELLRLRGTWQADPALARATASDAFELACARSWGSRRPDAQAPERPRPASAAGAAEAIAASMTGRPRGVARRPAAGGSPRSRSRRPRDPSWPVAPYRIAEEPAHGVHDDRAADELGDGSRGPRREVGDAHVPAGRGLRDDVGHERPVDRQEHPGRRAEQAGAGDGDRDVRGHGHDADADGTDETARPDDRLAADPVREPGGGHDGDQVADRDDDEDEDLRSARVLLGEALRAMQVRDDVRDEQRAGHEDEQREATSQT